MNAGFEVSRSHCIAGSVKTNASRAEVYDIFRTWIRTHPVHPDRLKDNSAAQGLLSNVGDDGAPVTRRAYDLDTEHERAKEVIHGTSTESKAVRYQMNPQANWGPGTAAKGHRKRVHRSLAPDELKRRAKAYHETTE